MDARQARFGTAQERDGQAGALSVAATRLLRAGEPRRAFELADRRCRLPEPPGAADRAVRALAGRLCGWPFWQEDLAAAREADPLDPVVNSTVLRLGTADERLDAARHLVLAPHAPPHAVQDALTHLFCAGLVAAVRLDLVDNRLSGWVAWHGAGDVTLEIEGASRRLALPLAAQADLDFVPENGRGAMVEAVLPFQEARGFAVRGAGEVLAQGPLVARSRRGSGPAKGEAPGQVPERAPLVVVVPVFDDLEATSACLEAAIAQTRGRPATRLIVVDDASPNAALRDHLDDRAAQGLVELRRNAHNLGFGGAVRRGLEGTGGADILLLNADALLPRDGLDRLADAAYAAPEIGTVTPLSNNGEYTSFPVPGRANAAPSPEEAAALDAAAAGANAGRLVDLPTGTGFCLYVRHDCRAAVGEMPGLFGRGYFEDMELCLKAREVGYRNVCAGGVFVAHHGSLSFGADKAALVSRNLRLLRRRHPETLADCSAHVAADPLREARAAIEAVLPPRTGGRLLVGPRKSALLAFRLAELGGDAAQLSWSSAGGRSEARLLGPGALAPQSLVLDLEHGAALAERLRSMAPDEIEIVAGALPPASLAAALATITATLSLVLGEAPPIGDADLLAPVARWRAALGLRLQRLLVCDGQSLETLARDATLAAEIEIVDARGERDAAPVVTATGAPVSLGIVCPTPSPQGDAFVRHLASALRRALPEARLVVLGESCDAVASAGLGNVVVTGAIARAQEIAILGLFGLRALALPPASPCLAEFERLADRSGLPRAVADWTFGKACPPSPSTLHLDPHCRDAGNAFAIADWFAHRIQAPPA
ncbi:glycosyltransferase [Aurantimonas sp. Leaf443]|uniref:glycosyltransferase n=1 Tax=Aurantimonas sp. Leaf443 TaxID=1736378 RepID=UPI0006F20E99|nr:glycosyltransferase [Aurantimonas sp. Leaf443]KQT82839.1 hypothetical protein ASG48_15240 [Aurantimonas sp. Leaf443]